VTAGRADAGIRVSAAPQAAIAGLVLVTVAIVLFDETLARTDRPASAVIWGGVALAAFAGGLACVIAAAQHGDLGLARWKIGPWTLLWYSLTFGISTMTWSQPQTGDATEIVLSSVLKALWLIAVGMTAWTLGYLVGPGWLTRGFATRAMGRLSHRFAAEVRSPAAPWILYAIGLAARLASTATTGVFGYVGDPSSLVASASGYGGLLSTLTLCAPLAVAAAALQVFRERIREARTTLAVLFLFEVAFGAAAGGKASFVIAALAVAIPFSAARLRLPKTALLVLVSVFLVVVIPFNQAYRNVARQGSATLTPRQAVAVAPGILRQVVTGQNVATVVPKSVAYLLQRNRQIDSPAIILQRTPGQLPFLSPVQLVEGPVTGMVPRAIWPGKPIVVTGLQFSHDFFELPSTLYTATADTLIGGLYWHGGWVPVLVGMLLLGCGVRLLDDVLDVRANPHAIFLVLLIFPNLVGGQEDWLSLLTTIPATTCVWLAAVAFTFRVRRPALRASRPT
jgi:hypothetical protein